MIHKEKDYCVCDNHASFRPTCEWKFLDVGYRQGLQRMHAVGLIEKAA